MSKILLKLMKNKFRYLLVYLCFHGAALHAQSYKDPGVPVTLRVKDLLSRMTLEEKVAQMNMNSLKGSMGQNHAAGVVESPFVTSREIAGLSFQAKAYAREKTRLGIPPIQIGEGLHGVLAAGCTIFPQTIAQGATWNPGLVKKMAEVIAVEASAIGIDQALSPLFDLIRDPRYGRVEECFAEDPFLVGHLGDAFVCGLQGPASKTKNALPAGKVMATAKHFAAYSYPLAGVNLAPAPIGERELRTMFLPPFEKAVRESNIYALMPSYNEIDGIPAHSSTLLLDQILRKEWGFGGYVFSDYGGLGQLYDFHQIAKDPTAAAILGLKAGVDLEAARPDAYKELARLSKEGQIDIAAIDSAVSRILTVKFKAGLFEKKLPDSNALDKYLHLPSSVSLSREIAAESVTLLKNQGGLLPLDLQKIRSLAVIGPNADKVQYGDYSYTRDNRSGITVLQGIRQYAGNRLQIRYEKGCELSGSDRSGFSAAVDAASKADAVVVVLGTTSVVFQGIGWNGKAGKDEPKDPFSCGEGYDVTDIAPQGVQRELLQAVYATGKPVILLTIKGRPWSIDWEKEHIPAILEAWYPGEKGGEAIADILFGKINPSGRLNMSIPRSSGHIPLYYNYLNSAKGNNREPGTPDHPGRDYVYSATSPLFPFGYGLSYTSFEYSNLQLSKKTFGPSERITISLSLSNTGKREGKEVVQLYIGNRIASVSTPVKALRGFQKITLRAGESKKVTFEISSMDLEIWNREMKRVSEPGPFRIMIGKSSEEILLSSELELLP
jgi:beta-glucosidase